MYVGCLIVGELLSVTLFQFYIQIQDQVIFGKEYECKPPYNNVLRERKFAYVDGKIQVIL